MTVPEQAPRTHLVGALLGLVLAWAAAATWGGLALDPRGYLAPLALGGLAVVLTGVGLRRVRTPGVMVAAVQLVVAGLALHTAYAATLPRPSTVRGLVAAIEQGAAVLSSDVAPVDRSLPGVHLLLLGCALLLLWGVDVLAWSVGHPPLAGLPVLAGVSVPVTLLLEPVRTSLFVAMAAAYVLLLATDRGRRHRRAVEVAPARWRERVDDGLTAGQVALVAVLAAVMVAPLVPLGDPLRPGGSGFGTGSGPQVRVTTQNPFIALRRDLLEQTDTPMVYARTDAPDPTYLRTVVLDSFTSESWNASDRLLPSENAADGVMPAPPGLAAGTGGVESRWELQLDQGFRTRWLPLPSPLREISVSGEWRYDERFLDVALPTGGAEPGLAYEAIAFRPAITARSLDRALSPPTALREQMTAVPDELPPVIARTAREVTQGAETPYEQAVALQDWFRQDGGFTYSLEQGDGDGLDLLARFVTTDRVGYCEQFAAAMAAMGRTLGIPSRVAVGFLAPEELDDGRLLYTSDARHAWPEMYFTGIGWVRFEPTPASRTGESPDYTRQSVDAEAPSAAPSGPTEAPEQQSGSTNEPESVDQGAGVGAGLLWLLLLVVLAGALALPSVVRRRQRQRRLSPGAGRAAEGAWAELRAVSLDTGLGWDDDRSPREQARALVGAVSEARPDDVEALDGLLRQVERGRFARAGTVSPEGGSEAAVVRRWTTLLQERAAEQHPGVVRRGRAAVLPASVVRRG